MTSARWPTGLVWLAVLSLPALVLRLYSDDSNAPAEPANWGSDHVGEPLPAFTSGDECLFCHRVDVGPDWPENRHGLTVRFPDADSNAMQALLDVEELEDLAGQIDYVMGNSRRQRFLKSAETHGRLELFSVEWAPPIDDDPGRLIHQDDPHWNAETFGESCAGCHATAVDATTQRFAAVSLDCYVCHGDIHEDHTERPELARFSRAWPDSAREEISVCGQCHLRGGRSQSSRLPYPNNFVPGDNLFLDFQVDLSDEALAEANPADGHILENVRDVVLRGEEGVTCLSCHDVHDQTSRRHRRLGNADICLHCHNAEGPKRRLKEYEVHSSTCRY